MKNNINILKDLKTVLKSRFGDNISDVILFGSRATGNPKKYSDYDILIVLNNKADWKYEREISNICYQIELKYDIIADEHLISKTELKSIRGQQPIFLTAIEKGVYA